jgi:hypothetical protein
VHVKLRALHSRTDFTRQDISRQGHQLTYVEDLTQRVFHLQVAPSRPRGDPNSCPPDQELGTLTKELAIPLRLLGLGRKAPVHYCIYVTDNKNTVVLLVEKDFVISEMNTLVAHLNQFHHFYNQIKLYVHISLILNVVDTNKQQ